MKLRHEQRLIMRLNLRLEQQLELRLEQFESISGKETERIGVSFQLAVV